MLRDRIVRQVTGGDNVRQQRAALAANAQALGQVGFDEVTMPSTKLAEGIERLDRACAFRPATSYTAGQGDYGNTPFDQRLHAQFAVPGIEFIGRCIFDVARDRQTILRETNTTGT